MNYVELSRIFGERPFFTKSDIMLRDPGFSNNRISDWQKKGYINRLANNFYVWANQRYDQTQIMLLANKIYQPSYISHKSALRFYNFIPEGVFVHFSVTTRKTKNIKTTLGEFHYLSCKTSLFFGYRIHSHNAISILIAEPEKALLDFLYLTPTIKTAADVQGLRLNYVEISTVIKVEKLLNYSRVFDNARVSTLTEILIQNLKPW